jgi:hypothetical protein
VLQQPPRRPPRIEPSAVRSQRLPSRQIVQQRDGRLELLLLRGRVAGLQRAGDHLAGQARDQRVGAHGCVRCGVGWIEELQASILAERKEVILSMPFNIDPCYRQP